MTRYQPFAEAMFFRNENHDPDDGQSTSGDGGGSGDSVEPSAPLHQDAALHGDHAAALAVGNAVMKRLGLSDERFEALTKSGEKPNG
jgi:hypothetical protein